MANRFVVQEHMTPEGVHWDLMIEQGQALTTFRLAESPDNAMDHMVQAIRIFDHPLRFLTYEGPVQKGAGRVRVVERGQCELFDESDDALILGFHGTILKGRFTLARTEGTTWRMLRI